MTADVSVEVTWEPAPGGKYQDGAAGIVENVVLMGAPLSSSDTAKWQVGTLPLAHNPSCGIVSCSRGGGSPAVTPPSGR